jgi:hypothetical protein
LEREGALGDFGVQERRILKLMLTRLSKNHQDEGGTEQGRNTGVGDNSDRLLKGI